MIWDSHIRTRCAMELKWLADFLSLANSQSFLRSAQKRNITQAVLQRTFITEFWAPPMTLKATLPTRNRLNQFCPESETAITE